MRTFPEGLEFLFLLISSLIRCCPFSFITSEWRADSINNSRLNGHARNQCFCQPLSLLPCGIQGLTAWLGEGYSHRRVIYSLILYLVSLDSNTRHSSSSSLPIQTPFPLQRQDRVRHRHYWTYSYCMDTHT